MNYAKKNLVDDLLPLQQLQPNESFKKRWLNFVDSGLHLFLSKARVRRVWRILYRYNLWRIGGALLGSLILTISMQLRATAQLLDDAESEVDGIFGDHLDGATDFVEVVFGSGRTIFLVIGVGLIAVALIDGVRNQGSNWHIWGLIGTSLILGVVLVSVWEGAIFG
ncbi:hypothetical protein [Myxosarcina sp. GI1]|uniref:hypothetical protein n=1 Tax=Myxosarcina sp. GI1 TaxID=1541065 RepID=UPI000562E126|nr:hypothetical protein [Myxosarcina sp. GI1]